MVFFMKNKMNIKFEKLLLGFAAGVMLVASIWSLILPSINMVEEQGKVGWIPASIGFLLGIIFLLVSPRQDRVPLIALRQRGTGWGVRPPGGLGLGTKVPRPSRFRPRPKSVAAAG